MSKNPKLYYTAGELADLFELPKQTLLYYDKMGVLSPEFISENNYRHYSLKQYLILEVILNMRKLGISKRNATFASIASANTGNHTYANFARNETTAPSPANASGVKAYAAIAAIRHTCASLRRSNDFSPWNAAYISAPPATAVAQMR